jgi:hypothetical protein
MTKNFKTPAEQDETDEHVKNAHAFMLQIVANAELRGLSGADIATSLACIVATRNATLAGKCLHALNQAIVRNPITKIIEPTAPELAQLSTNGPAN